MLANITLEREDADGGIHEPGSYGPAPPAARIPARLVPHVGAMYGYAAHGLEPGVHRGLPSDRLTLVFSLDQQPGSWVGIQLSLNPIGMESLPRSWTERWELHAAPDWAARYDVVADVLLRRARSVRRTADQR